MDREHVTSIQRDKYVCSPDFSEDKSIFESFLICSLSAITAWSHVTDMSVPPVKPLGSRDTIAGRIMARPAYMIEFGIDLG